MGREAVVDGPLTKVFEVMAGRTQAIERAREDYAQRR
jgi:hypothetical protein